MRGFFCLFVFVFKTQSSLSFLKVKKLKSKTLRHVHAPVAKICWSFYFPPILWQTPGGYIHFFFLPAQSIVVHVLTLDPLGQKRNPSRPEVVNTLKPVQPLRPEQKDFFFFFSPCFIDKVSSRLWLWNLLKVRFSL